MIAVPSDDDVSTLTAPARDRVLNALNQIVDPCSAVSVVPMGMVDMGLVRDVVISPDGIVDVAMRLTAPSCLMVAYFAKEADRVIAELPGVRAVELHVDGGLDWDPSFIRPEVADVRRRRLALLDSTRTPEPGPTSHREEAQT